MKKIPVTEIPAGEELSRETLESIFNFDDWSEEQFFTSIDTLICPHCKAAIFTGPPDPSVDPIWHCGPCGKAFSVRTVKSPLGLAWQTRQETQS